ncbi:MAG TPA: hypothetical protein DD379_07170, partial [Cyanobacteria bacterium UBA11162]|nr:hypothetical protein [Cyanobacteria bacterium UBA11162]
WLEKMLEPDVEDRFLSAKEALLVLRGKRMIRGKSKSSVPWKAIVGVGVGVVIFMSVVTSYKYALINALGFFPISVYLAVKRGDIDTVINYLNQGGNINVKDRQGDTLLHITVKYRTSYSYSKPSDDGTGSHPLVFFDYDDDYVLHVGKFVKYCRKDCAKLLIAKGADINAEDNQSHTPLYWAIKDSDRQMVELFIANGGQVNTKDVNATGDNPDADGFTLLNWAADNNRKDVAEWLIAKGADVNISYQGDNSSCSTPLFFAVRRNSIDVAKLLLAKGAQVNFSCKHYSPYFGDSKTPLSLAVKRGDTEMVELLKSYGAKE